MAIVANDAKIIAKSPGIGAKTAQKIILELSDKVNIEDMIGVSDSSMNSAGAGSNGAISDVAKDVISAWLVSHALAGIYLWHFGGGRQHDQRWILQDRLRRSRLA